MRFFAVILFDSDTSKAKGQGQNTDKIERNRFEFHVSSRPTRAVNLSIYLNFENDSYRTAQILNCNTRGMILTRQTEFIYLTCATPIFYNLSIRAHIALRLFGSLRIGARMVEWTDKFTVAIHSSRQLMRQRTPELEGRVAKCDDINTH